jgi:hypothetical protein
VLYLFWYACANSWLIKLHARAPKFANTSSRGVGQLVTECVVKVTGSKPLRGQKYPTMLRVGVAQAGCDPRVILTA